MKLKDFVVFCQPLKVVMIVVGVAIGYFLADRHSESFSWLIFFHLMFGVAISATASLILNQVWEWKSDAVMVRTQKRMIPAKKISVAQGWWLGGLFSVIGYVYLWFMVNPLASMLTILVGVDYVLLYTPLKKISWWNTPVGAISGAILPMVGWAARVSELTEGAWFLFAVLFLWQFPHSYAIYNLYRDDYARGGYKILPVTSPESPWSVFQTLMSALFLMPLSLLPYAKGYVGPFYAAGCLLIGVFLLRSAIRFYMNPVQYKARQLLRSSLIYLVIMLFLVVIDRVWVI